MGGPAVVVMDSKGRVKWGGLISLFAGTGSWHKTPLFVHSWDGKLLYEELLAGVY